MIWCGKNKYSLSVSSSKHELSGQQQGGEEGRGREKAKKRGSGSEFLVVAVVVVHRWGQKGP